MLYGCELAIVLGLRQVIFEFDSNDTISFLPHSSDAGIWEAFPTLSWVKQYGQAFHDCRWFWIPRSANHAADFLASRRIMKICNCVWVLIPPSLLVHVLSRNGLLCPLSSL